MSTPRTKHASSQARSGKSLCISAPALYCRVASLLAVTTDDLSVRIIFLYSPGGEKRKGIGCALQRRMRAAYCSRGVSPFFCLYSYPEGCRLMISCWKRADSRHVSQRGKRRVASSGAASACCDAAMDWMDRPDVSYRTCAFGEAIALSRTVLPRALPCIVDRLVVVLSCVRRGLPTMASNQLWAYSAGDGAGRGQ
jgi:hypothetical protein